MRYFSFLSIIGILLCSSPTVAQEPLQTNFTENKISAATTSTPMVPTTTAPSPVPTTSTTVPSNVIPAENDSTVQVIELVLAKDVVNRTPQGITESFSLNDKKAFAFAKLSSTSPTEITFIWFHEHKEKRRLTLPVGTAKSWRTYASVILNKEGQWEVVLKEGEKTLASKTFTVTTKALPDKIQ